MREVDLKLLWGRAASRCAICRCQLTQDSKSTASQFPIGEQAHIVGEKVDSPRGHSPLSPDERNRYHNLILLCPNRHTEIDKNAADYPVERLHQLKTDLELWVQDSLGAGSPREREEAEQLAYALSVDAVVEACRLSSWNSWTSFALGPIPQWPQDLPGQAEKNCHKVIGAVLPGKHPDLERAIYTLARSVHEAARHFMQHSRLVEHRKVWRADQFYNLDRWDPPAYERLSREWDEWIDECYELLTIATKAANWFAEEVRRNLNPYFFLKEGKFLITKGPQSDLSFSTELHEFTAEEKVAMPKALFERVEASDSRRRPIA